MIPLNETHVRTILREWVRYYNHGRPHSSLGLGLPAKSLEEVSPQGTKSFGDIVSGVFAPVLAKHTKSFNLADTLSVGVDRIQRNFEPMQRQVESWR